MTGYLKHIDWNTAINAQIEKNLYEKMSDNAFLSDVPVLLVSEIPWNSQEAYNCVMQNLICFLPGKSWKDLSR